MAARHTEEPAGEPVLVVVSGAPATGKTTIAREIAECLGIPYLGKDLIKEFLFDSLGVRDRDWSKKLGLASIELLFKLIEVQFRAGRSAVAECNYDKKLDVPRFERLREAYRFRMVEVHCEADRQVLLSRLGRRARSGDRHPGHVEWDRKYPLDAALADGVFDPLGLADELIRVDTTEFSAVDHDAVVVAVRRAARL